MNASTNIKDWTRSKQQHHSRVPGGLFNQLYGKQNGRCPICKLNEATHLDHDHSTGKIRSLLCNKCNLGLGLFKDNVNNLLAAIEYLIEHDHDEIGSSLAQQVTPPAQIDAN